MSKYIDMLNEQYILPSSDNSNSPYPLVFGKEPVDAELKELDRYTGLNSDLK